MNLGRESHCFTKDTRDTIKVGNYSMIAEECYFHDPNDNHLAKYNHQCVFTDNNMQPQTNTQEIEIGNDVWIGKGAKFLPGVKVGDGAIVGAWAVIAKDVAPFTVVVGNPAVVVRYRFDFDTRQKLMKMEWWNWDADKVIAARPDMLDIHGFMEKYG